jgi:hypothetical protein
MADNTSLQESAQALFCALADYIGEIETKRAFDTNRYPTFAEFRSGYTSAIGKKDVDTLLKEVHKKSDIDVSLNEIQKFLANNDDWWVSTINIAKEIIKEVNRIQQKFRKIKGVNWTNILYKRGDQNIMGTIDTLFKIAKKEFDSAPRKNVKNFAKRDKWNPADIYFATEEASKDLKKFAARGKDIPYEELNIKISDLIESGDLLPISLKKTKENVTVEPVNWDMSQQEKEIKKYGFHGIEETGINYLRIRIKKGSEKGSTMQMRHVVQYKITADQLRMAIEIGSAFGGGIGGKSIGEVISTIDQAFGEKFERTRATSMQKFKTERATLERKLSKVYGVSKFRDTDEYKDGLNRISQKHVTGVLFPLLTKYLKQSDKADAVMRAIAVYAKSMHPLASKHVLAS